MKYITAVTMILVLLSAGVHAADGYRLVWADEFEADGKPNPKNWTYERGFVRNNELQWYQPENAFCEDGKLIIEARRERRRNPNYRKDSGHWKTERRNIEYTSACLLTSGLHSWQYGRFEIRAKVRTEDGLWPAIWFLGVDGQWPSCGEIDLMEYYGGDILANACWGTETKLGGAWDTTKTPVKSFDDPTWDERFHLWRMDWDEATIKLYLDDVLLNTVDLTQTINPTDRGPKNPFHQPHYLLLNLAIGGTAGGDPSETDFPSRYEIDYVRVYQKEAVDHIRIDADENISLNGASIKMDALSDRMEGRRVVIHADKTVKHGIMAAVIKELKEAGVTNMSFAVEQP